MHSKQTFQVRRWVAACQVALLAIVSTCALAADADWRFTAPRVVAISDVHGDFDAMVATLRSAGVIDAENAWSGGDSALVIGGDLLDRGPESRRAMDLVMALEPAAAAAGGAVHMVLGNHEVMNLVGDLRYVSAAEYAAFAADEDPAERAAALERYAGDDAAGETSAEPGETFDARYPPGFFGHRRAFRSDGQYGQWLLEKPLVIVINDTAYTHGGLSPIVAERGLAGINEELMADLRNYMIQAERLTDAGLIDPADNFYDHAGRLSDIDTAEIDPELATAIEQVLDLGRSPIHALDSPLWYRGNTGCGTLIEADRLMPQLARIGAERVVIGHTPTLTRRVLSRMGGRIIEIDTGMLTDYYNGSGFALVIEGDSESVLSETGGSEALAVDDHPRRVGLRPTSLTTERIEALLATGNIESAAVPEGAPVDVTVTDAAVTLAARFIPNPGRDGFAPDLAAYRLDRLLGLDMVPVTVAREFHDVAGVLQFAPGSTTSEAERRESGQGGAAWCPLPAQWGAMYIFDALIHNPGRAQDRMRYSVDNWQLMLVGHDASFETSRTRPGYLRDVALPIGPAWQQALLGLTDEVIEAEFGDVLDRRRRRALGVRRDRLIEDATAED